MSQRSLKSPDFSRHGFQPLANTNESMSYEANIPLTTVRSAASSTTGARKQGEGTDMSTTSQGTFATENEKKSFFKSRPGPAGRRKTDRDDPNKYTPDGEEVSVNAIGRFYDKIIKFSIVTRYLVYVAPIALLIAAPIIIYSTGGRHNDYFLNTGVKVNWFWLWIEIVWLSIWVSKLASKAIPWIFMFLCGVVSSGTRKYALILKAVEIPLSLVGWAVTCLLTFKGLTSHSLNEGNKRPAGKNDPGWIEVMIKLLGPAVIASLMFLAEKSIIQLISVNYHRRSFDGRIKESKHSIYLLGLLYDASRTLFPMYCREFMEEDYIINDGIEAMIAQTTGKKVHHRSGSATPLKLIGDIGRVGDKVTSIFGNIASEITGKQVFNPNSAHSVVVEALEKTRSSEALAKRLWMSFVVEGKDALFVEDVEEVLGPNRKEEAEEVFASLDNDGNGDISLDEMIMKVVEIGHDRKSIAASMRDVGQAIGVLDQIIMLILFIIIIFIFVAFQNTNFVTMLATAGTTLLSLSFVFAATTQEFLGSCIFLFVKHPYDVGDRIDMVGSSAEHLVVEQISLLFTIFKRIDNMKMVQVPNIVLNNLWIENVTRSKAMKEQLDMFISFDTSLEDIELLRQEMESFVRHPDNSRDFQPEITLEATGIGNMDKLQLKVEIRHKSNWSNETVRAARRSKFMCALVLALRKIPIYAPGGGGEALGGPTNPGYSVAISDTWATEARDKAKEAKEGKRLVPSAPKTEDAAESENNAAQTLNARNPASDAAWTSGIDDRTLGGSRSESPSAARRSAEIEGVRQGLLKRQSTRGRRQPGVSIPPLPNDTQPGMTFTAASPTKQGFRASMEHVLDEEAELGIHPTHSTNAPYSGSGAGYNVALQPGQYNVYPPTSNANANAQGYQQQSPYQQQGQHALNSTSSSRVPVQGQQQGRSRGASVSQNGGAGGRPLT
ncbi:putative MscS family protein [Lachnellula hyalina]|uniref:Mechanosensitive ion channel protein n=1 Tax=Lachnellula hyalina TaxID=1316788 RepID=A0A8H8TYR2_9HELO|nr:putative MscS family protein [Lachnellula hyalina]TVY24146.1 putative MscS family protein [Lachnellula hyalina]